MAMKRKFAALSGAALAGLLVGGAYAATESVVVEVEFVEPITITVNNQLQFGLLSTGFANNNTVAIASNDGVTQTGGTFTLGGTQAAADLTVTATAGSTITILIDNLTNGAEYALSNFVCNYGGTGETGCDVAAGGMTATAAASATLEIGATITGNGGNAGAGVDNGAFDVIINYL